MRIASAGSALPDNYYPQEVLSEALKKHWADKHYNLDRLDQLHRNVLVGGRHLALPLEQYDALGSFTEANDAFIRAAVDVGARAVATTLARAGLEAHDVDHLFFVSTTGIATPSIDARIANRIAFRPDFKRTPIFGLGCAAGAVGITRASDYVRAYPGQVALLLSVELCSLTLQRKDLSIPNIIASGLFGDGAAGVALVGEERKPPGPRVVATRSVFYPETERVMGWDISEQGFQVVLSADIPSLVRREVRRNVDEFLAARELALSDIDVYICHPGGPRVLEAFREALELEDDDLALTWDSLRRVGNLSSASILFVLEETLRTKQPEEGSYGLLMALGPGFCCELVLIQW